MCFVFRKHFRVNSHFSEKKIAFSARKIGFFRDFSEKTHFFQFSRGKLRFQQALAPCLHALAPSAIRDPGAKRALISIQKVSFFSVLLLFVQV